MSKTTGMAVSVAIFIMPCIATFFLFIAIILFQISNGDGFPNIRFSDWITNFLLYTFVIGALSAVPNAIFAYISNRIGIKSSFPPIIYCIFVCLSFYIILNILSMPGLDDISFLYLSIPAILTGWSYWYIVVRQRVESHTN